MFDLETLK